MNRFTAEGLAILMISSDLPELLGMSDRIVVMRDGRTTGTLDRGRATPEARHGPRDARMRFGRLVARYAIFAALGVECLVLSLTSRAFFTVDNLANVLRQNAFPAVIAAGMTFVILTAGIDLSVGSVVGLAGVLCADVLAHGWGLTAGIAMGLLVGAGVGLLNGVVVTRRPRAAVHRDAGDDAGRARRGVQVHRRPHDFGLAGGFSIAQRKLDDGRRDGGVFALSWLLLMRTPFGRHVYAVGGNDDAAWLSGVRVKRVLLAVYALCGLSAGLAGVLVASRLNAGLSARGRVVRARRHRRRRRRRHEPVRRPRLDLGHAGRRVLHRHPEQRPEPVQRQSVRSDDRQRRGAPGGRIARSLAERHAIAPEPAPSIILRYALLARCEAVPPQYQPPYTR